MPDIRWARRGFVASLLIGGAGTLAAKWGSWLHLSPVDSGGYQVIAQWAIPAGGKGLIVAVSPSSTIEELRAFGKRLQKQFRTAKNASVMIFDDAEAARQVRRGYRVIGEKRFQAALAHQRGMYLKSSSRGEDSLTIYKSYPVVNEVIRFG